MTAIVIIGDVIKPESYAYEAVAPRIGDIDDYDEVFEDDDD